MALVVFWPFAACTSDHPFIDPELFYGGDAGVVHVAEPAAVRDDAGMTRREQDAAVVVSQPPTLTEGDERCDDQDADSICDELDRCPAVANQDDAEDVDEDGLPDACDPCGPAQALALAPLFYFGFDEASDANAAQNRGSANSSAEYVNGAAASLRGVTKPDRAKLHLPGQGNTDYPRVAVHDVTAFPRNALTLSVWLRTSQTGDFSVLSYATGSDPNHFLVSFIGGGPLRIGVESVVMGSSGDVTPALADGSWHHVVITGQVGGELSYYVDAVLVDHVPTPAGSALDPGGVLIIGQDQDLLNGGFDVAQAFEGDIDELALYARELDAQQIAELFAATTCL
jgi:hypothetical protein